MRGTVAKRLRKLAAWKAAQIELKTPAYVQLLNKFKKRAGHYHAPGTARRIYKNLKKNYTRNPWKAHA